MKSRFQTLLSALLLAMSVAHLVPSKAQATPVLLGTLARKVHGAAGTFDLALGSVASNPTTEPRLGPTHTIVFTFDGVVTAGTASVTEGTATVGVPSFSGSELIVPLTGVSNAQYVTINVTNVSTAGGGTGGGGSTRIGFLAGDVNQNRVVSLADLGLVNAQLAQAVTASNFLKDVNASGTLTLADKGLTNARLTQALPAPGDAAPSVVATAPAANATNVSPNVIVSIQFSEPVTVSGAWFQMACTSGTRTPANTAVSGDLSASTGTTFTLAPNVSFAFGDACTVTIFAIGISDIDTQDPPDHMAADFVFSFTMSATDSPPVVQNDSTSTTPGIAVQLNVLANDSDPDHDPISVVSFGQGTNGTVTCLANGSCAYTPNAGFTGIDNFSYTVGDGHGPTTSGTVTVTVSSSDTTVTAPPLDLSTTTTVDQGAAFLYTGPNPVQTGVPAGTIQATRASILRGRVTTRDGNVLPGVVATILNRPEFGQTVSRSNGYFDIAVNGGGVLTISYQASGFLPAQRQVNVPWQGYVVVPDVALIALDSKVTTITSNAAVMQVHRANPSTDSDGTRSAALLFPAGTTATMVLANGTTQPLASLDVRASEYTVGPNGSKSMPAPLPATSAYTYAVEFSADQALAAGARSVTFNQPVIQYAENFLNFPVGIAVPTGFYDRQKAAWMPLPNGRVIKILSITGGLADVDTDGDNVADNGLGITTAERQNLAVLYAPGQSLWRTAIPHFSVVDNNWAFVPADASSPSKSGAGPDNDDPLQDPDNSCGCVIENQNQVLGESVPIVGTRYALAYRSDREPGRSLARTFTLSGPSALSPSLASIELHIAVAGKAFDQTFPPVSNQKSTFVWDGHDVYGRALQGGQLVTGSIDYVYPANYMSSPTEPSFAVSGGSVLLENPTRGQFAISLPFSTAVGEGLTDPRPIGLGGWTLSPHHFYDPVAQVLHTGDGKRRRAENLAKVIETSLKATDVGSAQFSPNEVKFAADGTMYVSSDDGRVYRKTTNGTISIFAGGGGSLGDGGPATSAKLVGPFGLALAPDGSVYIGDRSDQRVRRVDPNGIITTVAGTGVLGFSGDGGPATLAQLDTVNGIAVAPDGTLYIADQDNGRIRRVGPDGIITTFAGTGGEVCSGSGVGDGGPATQAGFCDPFGLALGPDGSLYIADEFNQTIRRIGPDGIINAVAGNGQTGFSGDGIQATQAQLSDPFDVAFGPDGTMYIADLLNLRVRAVRTDGVIFTVAGNGAGGTTGDGGPATAAPLGRLRGVAVAPDGTVYIADNDNKRVRRVEPALPGFTNQQFLIASVDGSELYSFDVFGRHLQTIDAMTGGIRRVFTYDSGGRLSQITEKTGGTDNVTTIQHDANGNPTKIVGPFGHQTSLSVDANGFLAGIANPAGESVQLTSTSSGLLTNFTDARGKTTTFAYGADGRLLHDGDPAGGTEDLARTEGSPGTFTVARTSALNRDTTYEVENLPGNVQKRTVTAPDGTQLVTQQDLAGGTTTVTAADGTISNVQIGADPRFGVQVPIPKSLSIALPSGLNLTSSETRTAVLSNPTDPLSLVSLTDASTVSGNTTTSVYTASTRTLLTTTPAGRTATLTLDAFGRIVSAAPPGLASTSFSYDSRGRIATVVQGAAPNARTTSFSYNANGYLQSITDPIGRIAQLTYDPVGRVVSKVYSDGGVAQFSYDAAGNMTGLTPPGRPAYAFAYSDRNELTNVTPPSVAGTGPTSYAYNLDRQPTTVSRPEGRTVTLGYDTAGRMVTRGFATSGVTTGIDTLNYDGAGRLAGIAASGGVTTSYSYDGPLMTGRSWAGAISGNVTRTYDTSFRMASELVNGANAINVTYDNDDRVIGVGGLAITRDSQSGLPTGGSLGTVTTSIGYNGFGEVTGYNTTSGATALFSDTLTRDALGRITAKTEAIGGGTDAYVYTYETSGQLANVSKNAVTIESYGYDSNGNRTSATVSGSAVAATYDSQDRLSQYGTILYAYNAGGDLLTKTNGAQITSYQYDAIGSLVGATLPGGTVIAYVVDGNNRRVGKKINGTLVKGYLYGDQLRMVAELDGAGTVVGRFVYAGGGIPVAMIKGGVTYRVLGDQTGSVRLVVDSTTGAIVQRLDYDTFGNVTLDTNPGFQPFGFASGLYDGDTGLVRFGFRDYDASTGRWTAKDPAGFAGGDANLYRYASNDPVNATDRIGLDGILDTFGGFYEQFNADLTLATNPGLAVQVLGDSLTRYAEVKLGINDPILKTPTLYDSLFRPTYVPYDRMSADYTLGQLIAQCVEIVGVAAGGVSEGVGEITGRLDSAAVTATHDELANQVAARAAARAAPPPGESLEWIRPDGGGAGTSGIGKPAGGFTTRMGF